MVVRGREAAVIGQSKAAFYDYRRGRPKGEKDFVEVKAGGKYDLKARKAVDVPVNRTHRTYKSYGPYGCLFFA